MPILTIGLQTFDFDKAVPYTYKRVIVWHDESNNSCRLSVQDEFCDIQIPRHAGHSIDVLIAIIDTLIEVCQWCGDDRLAQEIAGGFSRFMISRNREPHYDTSNLRVSPKGRVYDN